MIREPAADLRVGLGADVPLAGRDAGAAVVAAAAAGAGGLVVAGRAGRAERNLQEHLPLARLFRLLDAPAQKLAGLP
jgi:hypothetical protein